MTTETEADMGDIIFFLKSNLAEHFVIYFIPLYYLGGRPLALISAQLLHHSIAFLFPVALLLDTIQIPFFYHVHNSISRGFIVKKLHQRERKKEIRRKNSRVFNWVQTLGAPGVVVIAALPLKGCGILSGFILSRILKLPKINGYLLLITGSALGCGLLLGIGEMVIEGWKYFLS
ncbi:MAG: small multi-drug export protein [Deltaproteobacteria bacterium]|jgi:uncharacterized membrane protein